MVPRTFLHGIVVHKLVLLPDAYLLVLSSHL